MRKGISSKLGADYLGADYSDEFRRNRPATVARLSGTGRKPTKRLECRVINDSER